MLLFFFVGGAHAEVPENVMGKEMQHEGGFISCVPETVDIYSRAEDLKTVPTGSDQSAMISHSLTISSWSFSDKDDWQWKLRIKSTQKVMRLRMMTGKRSTMVIGLKVMSPYFMIGEENDDGGSIDLIRFELAEAPLCRFMYKRTIRWRMWSCKLSNIGQTCDCQRRGGDF